MGEIVQACCASNLDCACLFAPMAPCDLGVGLRPGVLSETGDRVVEAGLVLFDEQEVVGMLLLD